MGDDPVQRLVDEIAGLRQDVTELMRQQGGTVSFFEAKARERKADVERVVHSALAAALEPQARRMNHWSREMRQARDEADRLRRDLAAERVAWRPWLYGAAAAGAAAMLLVAAFVVRMVPDGWSDRLYAAAVGADRWRVGASMMYRAGPEAFGAIRAADALLQRAGPEIEACLKAAEQAAKPHRCSFTVAPPPVPQRKAQKD